MRGVRAWSERRDGALGGGENTDPGVCKPAAPAAAPGLDIQGAPPPSSSFEWHTCEHCFKRCKSAELLRQHHAQARHSPHDPRCGACGKHFANLDTLRQHLDGQLPSQKCHARYRESGCVRCLAISPPGSAPHGGIAGRCPFDVDLGAAETSSRPSTSSSDAVEADTRGLDRRGRRAAVALDCEMVGTEEDGGGAMCARVCVVDEVGEVKLSTYVAPTAPVTDYRTDITGITAETLEGAPSIEEVRSKVLRILNGGGAGGAGAGRGGKVLLVGHDLWHDLECLDITHPRSLCRDTARYPPFQRHTHHPYKLRQLAADLLNVSIQAEGAVHDPKEDAVAAMRLYLGGRLLCEAQSHPASEHRGGGEAGSERAHSDVDDGAGSYASSYLAGGSSKTIMARSPLGETSAWGQRQEPRFHCWCSDFFGTVGMGNSTTRENNRSMTRNVHAGTDLNFVGVLKDSTNTKVNAPSGSTRRGTSDRH